MPEKTTATEYIKFFDQLTSNRITFDHHWQECADYVLPRKSDITVRNVSQGTKKMQKVYDSTGIQANEDMASALHGALTNPSSFFFALTVHDEAIMMDYPTKLWLDNATRKMHSILSNSNFHTELLESYLDIGCFGTAPLMIEEDFEKIVRFQAHFVGDTWILTNAYGVVDTMVRKFTWSAAQAVERFGAGKLPTQIKEDYLKNQGLDPQWEFIQIIEPRKKYDEKKKDGKNMPIKSVYVSLKDPMIVSESGFRELPFAVPRWSVVTGEHYGRSPTMKALPDIKMLNRMEQTMIRAGQKAVDPPIVVNNRGQISPVRTMPGGITYVSPQAATARDPISTLYGNNSLKLPYGWEASDRKRVAIREAYYLDQLASSTEPLKTHVPADEYTRRNADRLRRLGPILSRMQHELLRPIVSRVFGIALRRGLLPPPPPALRGQLVQVTFDNPISKIQHMEEGDSLMRTVAATGPMLETNPALLDNIDQDTVFREIASISNMPSRWLKDPRAVQQIRQERQERAEAELEEQKTAQGAELAAKLGSAAGAGAG